MLNSSHENMTATVLVVDDEPDILELLTIALNRLNLTVHAARNYMEACNKLSQERYQLCLTDMRMPNGTGLDLVQYIAEHCPHLPVAIVTAHGDVETAVQALKYGAFDFVMKPLDLTVLKRLVQHALKLSQPRLSHSEPPALHRLLGRSAVMQQLRQTIIKVARSQAPVFVSGESGAGKELVAKLIHELSPRGTQNFVPVNCGAIPTELMESEFFGHKKGSFTGAHADKEGLFTLASQGTLFLDEIADLPLLMQVKLLRALQEKSIRPIGARQEISTDVRIISATHRSLINLIAQGVFRQDLFYRLNVIEVHVPALRERREDIPQLAEHLLTQIATNNQTTPYKLAETALIALQQYDFPGNIRELENILERATTLCEQQMIWAEDLQLTASTPAVLSSPNPNNNHNSDTTTHIASTPPSAINETKVKHATESLPDYVEHVEREAIMAALQEARYNKTATAKKLGISFRALRYKLQKLGIR